MLLIMKSASHVFAILNFDPSCCCCYWLQMLTPSDLSGVTQTGATLTRCSPSMGRTTLTAPWTGDNLQELCQGMGSTTTTLIGGGHMYHQRDSWTIVHEFSVTFSPKFFITDCSKWAFWSWLEKRGVSKFQHNWGCQPNLKTLRKFTDSGPAVCPIIALYLLNSDYQGSPWLWGCRGWR